MNANIREHIQELNVMTGGGIISDKIRVDTIENPMLIIGLGGTGIDAMLRLKYQINRRFKLPEDSLTKVRKEKPDKIEFLGFETNMQEKNKKYKGIGLDPQSELVMLSNAEIGAILSDRKVMDPCISEWLSPELNISDGMKGACGVRQAGRLLLFTKINEVVESIEKKINTIMKDSKEKLYVFMLTGISGGTGSGCFLDIAYIVRGIMERKFGGYGIDRVNILGYLFTPDVNISKGLGMHERNYIMKNGYAALKELDYLMNISERGDRFKQKYKSALEVDSQAPPFDLCHLISATNKEGKLLSNAYDYCMNVTAENITNFMASEERQAGQEFAIHDYISNIEQNIKNMEKPYSANYKYNIIGASSAVLPIEEITTYLAYKVFEKMDVMFEKSPTEQDVDQFIRMVKLDKDAVEARFERENLGRQPISGYKNRDKYEFANVIKKEAVNMDEELSEYLRDICDEYLKVKRQYPGEISVVLNQQIDRMFKDASKGPFYASKMLFSNEGFNMVKTLEIIKESLIEKHRRLPDNIKNLREDAQDKFDAAKKTILFTKESKKNDYIEAKIEEYYARTEEERTLKMIEFYQNAIEIISNLNNKIYKVYTEILNELNKVLKDDGNILVKGEEVQVNSGKTYYWNLINVPDVVKTIDKMVCDEDTNDLIRRFTDKLLGESQKWIDEQHMDIVGSISNFVSEEFGDIITKSMEDFLIMKYGEEKSIERLIQTEIAPRLDEDAIPIFQLQDAGGSLIFPSWNMVSVPAKTPRIYKGIKEYKESSTLGHSVNIKRSKVSNKIFWLNTENGVPLYAYTSIRQYEKIYEESIFTKEGIGRHLIQTRETNWTYLPSPIPEKSWGTSYHNERVKKYNSEIRQVFDKAVSYGCIERVSAITNSQYKVVVTKEFNIEKFLLNYDLAIEEGKTPNMAEIRKCIGELRKLMQNKLENIEDYDLQMYYIFDSRDEEVAKENLIRSPRLIQLLNSEIEKYEAIEQQINKLGSNIYDNDKKTKLLDNFIQAMYTETICKKGIVYMYDKDADERTEIEPFVNLMKQKQYAEFSIYNKYCEIDEKHRNVIEAKSDKRLADLSIEEGTTTLYSRIKCMIENYSKAIEELDYRRYEIENGQDMYSFYVNTYDKLKEIRVNLE
ncbi:tubulin-like doman-containing protein [Clostridium sp. FP1]|uniref:tubulin-like doman-containing protein n=1 Tax=Clostridium sp. FP1 TaxID=2724076 RepID=UPI0013E9455A|nr:tubulin-like doman-containing protein [Clostridium sp. FP1]MBZ9635036.1 tubulin-like doman-containing protein [Clostridium sp. FP1]